MFKELFELSNSFVILILWSQVNFSQDYEEWNLQEETKPNVLFGHFLHTHVSTNNNHTIVWGKTSQAIYCSFKVLFVTAEISNGNYFAAEWHNLIPILVFVLVESFWDDLFALLIKAHNLMSNGTGSASFLLMKIVENPDTCRSITIIFDTFGKD